MENHDESIRHTTLSKNIKISFCRVTNRSPNLDRLGYGPNKPNTIICKRVGKRIGLVMGFTTANRD